MFEIATVSAGRGPLAWIERAWNSIADRGRAYVDVPGLSVPPLEGARQLAGTLLSGRGEASGAALARELQSVLSKLSRADRLAFCLTLATDYAADTAAMRAAAQAYADDPTPANARALAQAVEPPRQELLRRMNQATGGTKLLVSLRQEILGVLRQQPELAPLDDDLRHLLASWFNRGFLALGRIDWNTPAAVLEKLIVYEAVHEIEGWEDLRRRLGPDRRCFAFFHPALPGEPLIFVEVALTQGLADAVQPLLLPDTDAAAQATRGQAADTAIFYSISNCQDGLRGISFGNFLIKQVVEELKGELPQLKQFATLSPVPGFRRWLEARIAADDETLLRAEDVAALRDAAGEAEIEGEEPETPIALLARMIAADEGVAPGAVLRPLLSRLCAEYLTQNAAGRGPTDPVARFHLGNGARLERVNWHGNVAVRGLRESFGLMVNYLYDPDAIEQNHEAFARAGQVARSPEVDMLLAPMMNGAAKRRAGGVLRIRNG